MDALKEFHLIAPKKKQVFRSRHLLFTILLVILLRSGFAIVFRSLPFGDQLANIMDLIILYAYFSFWLFLRLPFLLRWKRTPLDTGLFLLIISMSLSMLLNNALTLGAFDNILKLLRYLPVYYLITQLRLDAKDRWFFRNVIVKLGRFLSVSTIVFYIVHPLDVALEKLLSPIGLPLKKVGSVRLIFATQTELASFLLFALIVYLYSAKKARYPGQVKRLTKKLGFLLSISLFLFAIFATYKRAFLIAAFGVLLWYMWQHKHITQKNIVLGLLIVIGIILALLGLFLSLGVENILQFLDASGAPLGVRESSVSVALFLAQLFSPIYWQKVFAASRGWTLFTFAPRFLTSQYWMWGTGPDGEIMRATVINRYPDLDKILVYQGFEDVYWVATMAYYGVMGLLLLWSIGFKLFMISRRMTNLAQDWVIKGDAQILSVLVFWTFIMGFIVRIPELAAISFIFWVYSGLVVSSYIQMRRQQTAL